MTAFPTSNAGTTHLDAGTDSPKQARSDLKQNVDNTNALMEFFNDNDQNKISLGRLIINDQAAGTFSTESSSAKGMLYNNGIQIEAAGQYEYPALVLKTFATDGYPNIWAARSKNNTFGQNTHLGNNDTIFKFFGAGFDGTDYNTSHAEVELKAAEDHDGSAQGGKIVFSTVTNGTKVSASRMTMDNDVTSEVKFEFNKNYKEKITALTSATTIAVDCSLGSVFTCTLSHNANFVLSNFGTGESVSIILTQDTDSTANTGTFYAADSTAVKFSEGLVDLAQQNGGIDIVHIFNDGTNLLGTVSPNYRTI